MLVGMDVAEDIVGWVENVGFGWVEINRDLGYKCLRSLERSLGFVYGEIWAASLLLELGTLW